MSRRTRPSLRLSTEPLDDRAPPTKRARSRPLTVASRTRKRSQPLASPVWPLEPVQTNEMEQDSFVVKSQSGSMIVDQPSHGSTHGADAATGSVQGDVRAESEQRGSTSGTMGVQPMPSLQGTESQQGNTTLDVITQSSMPSTDYHTAEDHPVVAPPAPASVTEAQVNASSSAGANAPEEQVSDASSVDQDSVASERGSPISDSDLVIPVPLTHDERVLQKLDKTARKHLQLLARLSTLYDPRSGPILLTTARRIRLSLAEHHRNLLHKRADRLAAKLFDPELELSSADRVRLDSCIFSLRSDAYTQDIIFQCHSAGVLGDEHQLTALNEILGEADQLVNDFIMST